MAVETLPDRPPTGAQRGVVRALISGPIWLVMWDLVVKSWDLVRSRSSVLHVVISQAAIERTKAGFEQMQVRFERLLQETGGPRPRGIHFCCWQRCLSRC